MNLNSVLLDLAEEHMWKPSCQAIPICSTAQPISFCPSSMAYYIECQRDSERLHLTLKHTDLSPRSAAALAVNNFSNQSSLSRIYWGSTTLNSPDAVSDRDFILEFIKCQHFDDAYEPFLWGNHQLRSLSISTYSGLIAFQRLPWHAPRRKSYYGGIDRGKTDVYGHCLDYWLFAKSLLLP